MQSLRRGHRSTSWSSLMNVPYFIGWLFDITGDFRYVLHILFVVPVIAAVLIAISSRVKVEKHLSLAEKVNTRKIEDENTKVEDSHHCFLDSVVITKKFFYHETSV